MAVLQQLNVQIEEIIENASSGAENCLKMIELGTSFDLDCDLSLKPYPTPEFTQNSFRNVNQDLQLLERGNFNATCDPPMSFRNRHRLLNGIYNSYPDPTLITAEDMGDVAQKVGLLMEEVLAWFKDEKLRRAELIANNELQAQVSTCQFPTSPESTRASGEVSSASSSCNSASPETSSQPLNTFLPCPTSSEEKKTLTLPKSKRGRPAKTHIKLEPDIPSPDTKKLKTSMKYPCLDCGNFLPSERYAEHINRKHFPENVWECPKINQQTGKPCLSSPHYRPSYRPDNFATHLKGEHDCSDSEVIELKKSCKFEVLEFFHNVCGFCDEVLGSRSKSIEHIKEHFKKTLQEPNPPTDLGVSLWKENCGSEHKLQRGLHYRRNKGSNSSLITKSRDHDHEGHQGKDGGSSESNSDYSGHGNSDSRPNNSTHDCGTSNERHSGKDYSDNQSRDSLDSQPNDGNQDHNYENSDNRQFSEDSSGGSSHPKSTEATFHQSQSSMKANEDKNLSAYPPQNIFPQYFPFSVPQSYNHDTQIYSISQDIWPSRSVVPYAKALPYNMESPDLRPPSYYSPSFGSSASSSVMSSPFSNNGSAIFNSEWNPSGLGLHPSIVNYESSSSQEYSFGSGYIEELPQELNTTKPDRLIGGYIFSTKHEDSKEEVCCKYPDCGKMFKDLKSHMLTHRTERPEKCPIEACDYHTKGFARKYDKNRHTLTHYRGTMVCGFCPGSGSAAERSFNRADVFKRHLTSVHAVEQMPPNSRKKILVKGDVKKAKELSGYVPDAAGNCSICSARFSNAQEFYDHLDDCVLRIVQQQEPSEAINATQSAEVKTHSTDKDQCHGQVTWMSTVLYGV